jgi:ABC-type hemin transport system substrate-binding protein
MPTTIPADRAEKVPRSGRIVAFSSGVTTVIAKKPYTIVGMPARISRIGLMIKRTRWLANSLIQTAARIPSGTARTSAMKAIMSVLVTSGMTPNAYGKIDADQRVPVKKSTGGTSAKKKIVSTRRTVMMPTVVMIPMAAAARRRNSMSASPLRVVAAESGR